MRIEPGPFRFNANTTVMALRRTSPCVYFVREIDGPVKIGRSNADALDRRLTALQIGNPRALELAALVCMTGSKHVGVREEGRLHKHFSDWRIRGEWFEPSESLNLLISEFSIAVYGGHLRAILRSALRSASAA